MATIRQALSQHEQKHSKQGYSFDGKNELSMMNHLEVQPDRLVAPLCHKWGIMIALMA